MQHYAHAMLPLKTLVFVVSLSDICSMLTCPFQLASKLESVLQDQRQQQDQQAADMHALSLRCSELEALRAAAEEECQGLRAAHVELAAALEEAEGRLYGGASAHESQLMEVSCRGGAWACICMACSRTCKVLLCCMQ